MNNNVILDEKLYSEFKIRYDLWVNCFNGEDTHCIMNQIYRLVWNVAVFYAINEARKIAPPAKEGGIQLNGTMFRLFDSCFFESQMLAIRRLTDTESLKTTSGKRDVIALTSLIRDMKQNASIITRQYLFMARGLEYDYMKVKRKEDNYLNKELNKSKKSCWIPSDFNWEYSSSLHNIFDKLCGKDAKQRSPYDSIKPEVFEYLEKRVISACNNIKTYVNKFVAHSATPWSRQLEANKEFTVTLDSLNNAIKVICSTANFIDSHLLTGAEHHLLAVPQFNQFLYIDKPLISKQQIGKIYEAWQNFNKQSQEWKKWDIGDFIKEFNRVTAV